MVSHDYLNLKFFRSTFFKHKNICFGRVENEPFERCSGAWGGYNLERVDGLDIDLSAQRRNASESNDRSRNIERGLVRQKVRRDVCTCSAVSYFLCVVSVGADF